ncbi:MAG TPA: hypothetical protein VIJ77_08275 [Candidatus Tumulicola sp.]
MIGLSHAILHVALCGAIARAKPEANVALHVRLLDRRQKPQVDRVFHFERGDDDNPKVVEFDVPQGTYRLEAGVAKYGCSATDYLAFLPDRSRSVNVALAQGQASPLEPLLMEGTSPQSFLYVQPTFVLLDKNATGCNKPIGDIVPSHVVIENDQDAYYAWLYSDTAAGSQPPVQLALRLKTPTHQYHYVRLPIPYPMPWGGWPNNVQFDVTQDEIDGLASEPVDTLLCLHLWETKVYL